MTFAGYNAGRGRVRQWMAQHGDPRDPNVDEVDWVERIPLSETRNYVQRVMENLQMYGVRFGASVATVEPNLHRAANVEQRPKPSAAVETLVTRRCHRASSLGCAGANQKTKNGSASGVFMALFNQSLVAGECRPSPLPRQLTGTVRVEIKFAKPTNRNVARATRSRRA